MSGKLVICPTPIGNLGDMTLRTLEELRAADVVCAEDTRVTGSLLAHFGIEKRLERLDEATLAHQATHVAQRVAAGAVVAFCSDAGMPGVSDPARALLKRRSRKAVVLKCCRVLPLQQRLMWQADSTALVSILQDFSPAKRENVAKPLRHWLRSMPCSCSMKAPIALPVRLRWWRTYFLRAKWQCAAN